MTSRDARTWGPRDLRPGQTVTWRGREGVIVSTTDVTALVRLEDGSTRTVDREDLMTTKPPEPLVTRAKGRAPRPTTIKDETDAAATEDSPAVAGAVEPCPECGRADFRDNKQRGHHRYFQHGVPGWDPTSSSQRRRRRAEEAEPLVAPPHDDATCPWKLAYEGALEALRALGGKG